MQVSDDFLIGITGCVAVRRTIKPWRKLLVYADSIEREFNARSLKGRAAHAVSQRTNITNRIAPTPIGIVVCQSSHVYSVPPQLKPTRKKQAPATFKKRPVQSNFLSPAKEALFSTFKSTAKGATSRPRPQKMRVT